MNYVSNSCNSVYDINSVIYANESITLHALIIVKYITEYLSLHTSNEPCSYLLKFSVDAITTYVLLVFEIPTPAPGFRLKLLFLLLLLFLVLAIPTIVHTIYNCAINSSTTLIKVLLLLFLITWLILEHVCKVVWQSVIVSRLKWDKGDRNLS